MRAYKTLAASKRSAPKTSPARPATYQTIIKGGAVALLPTDCSQHGGRNDEVANKGGKRSGDRDEVVLSLFGTAGAAHGIIHAGVAHKIAPTAEARSGGQEGETQARPYSVREPITRFRRKLADGAAQALADGNIGIATFVAVYCGATVMMLVAVLLNKVAGTSLALPPDWFAPLKLSAIRLNG